MKNPKPKKITYQKFIKIFIDKNYDELLTCAKKACNNTDYNPEDLVTELYMFLLKNKTKVLQIKKVDGKDRPYMRFCAVWIYASIRRQTENAGDSNFKAIFRKKDSDTELKFEHTENLVNESTPVNLEYFILDYVVKNQLTAKERKLYKLHFIQGKKIVQLMDVMKDKSRYQIGNLVSDLKQKLIIKCNEYRK